MNVTFSAILYKVPLRKMGKYTDIYGSVYSHIREIYGPYIEHLVYGTPYIMPKLKENAIMMRIY